MSNTPQKRAAQRRQQKNRKQFALLAVIAGLAIITTAIWFSLRNSKDGEQNASDSGTEGSTDSASRSPRLEVDQEVIDFGDVPFNQVVRATFTLTNTGAGDLVFSKYPWTELKEGC